MRIVLRTAGLSALVCLPALAASPNMLPSGRPLTVELDASETYEAAVMRPVVAADTSSNGDDVNSDIGPLLVVSVSPKFRFVDRQRFVLFENSDAEQHVFVEVGDDGSVSRLVWIQFEAYLPHIAERYNYSSSQRRIEIDGFKFFADSAPRVETPSRSGSDGEYLARLLDRHGLRLPRQRLWQRLVHVGEGDRSELMVIYLENLAPHGVNAGDLVGGPAADRWPMMADGLLERARQAVRFRRRE